MTDIPVGSDPDVVHVRRETPGSAFIVALRPALEKPRLVLGVGLLFALASGGWSLTRQRSWTSSASFMPESPRIPSGLSTLAVQFGANVGGDAGQSLQFYTDLVTSREILQQIAATRYNVTDISPPRSGDLVTLYKIKAPTEPLRREAILKRLRADIHATNSPKTGVVMLTVNAPWPSLAQTMATRLIDAVSAFNLGKRQSRAGAERRFVEGRLADARRDLLTWQNRLQDFMQSNRTTAGSPRLTLDQARIEQQVNLAQAQVTALNSAFEQARLDEVRNTPVITTLEDADYPARPNSRGGLRNTVLGGLLGVILTAIAVICLEKYRRLSARNKLVGEDASHTPNGTVGDI